MQRLWRNRQTMARFRRVPQTSSGIITGLAPIASVFGCSTRTIRRWIEKEGFPAATLPDGHIATTLTLVDLWLLGRLKVVAFGQAAYDASAEKDVNHQRGAS